MESRYQTDDSRAALIKESSARTRKRLDVQRGVLALLQNLDGRPAGTSETVDEIMAPVTGRAPAAPAVPAARAD
jgi:hypothetical protein